MKNVVRYLMQSEFPTFRFQLEFFDERAELIRPYILLYYSENGEIELFDVKLKKPFLKRTLTHQIAKKDLYIGNKLPINGRIYDIIDYADISTKQLLETKMQKTYAMLKPGFSQRIGNALDRIYREGLIVSKLQFGYISQETAQEFYAEHKGKPFFESLVSYITSDPVFAIEIVGNNAIAKWREIIGPTNLEVAKSKAPNSLRAMYAKSTTENFAHGSDSPTSSERELRIIFDQKSIQPVNSFTNSTLCIIKPHAVKSCMAGKIIQDIVENNFYITGTRMLTIDPTTAKEFYEVYRGVAEDFNDMVTELSSGPCIALELMKDNAVNQFRELSGPRNVSIARAILPGSLRAKYGTNTVKNAIHCTDLETDGLIENEFIFRLIPQ